MSHLRNVVSAIYWQRTQQYMLKLFQIAHELKLDNAVHLSIRSDQHILKNWLINKIVVFGPRNIQE